MVSQSKTPPINVRKGGRPPLSDARMNEFLDAAEQSFLEAGYASTSIDRLSGLAAISKKTIYSYYENKAAIFRAVIQRLGERALGDSPPPVNSLSFADGLKNLLMRISRVATNPSVVAMNRLVAMEGRKFPELAETLARSGLAHHEKPLLTYLEESVTKGLIRQVDCAAVTAILLSTVSAPLMNGVVYDTPVETGAVQERWINDICDLVINGLDKSSV